MVEKVVKSISSAKEQHTLKMLEYLANPENEIVNRSELCQKVLGVSSSAIYKLFTSDELSAIEDEALRKRRARFSLKLAQVDKALFEKAIDDKDVKAIELVYKKFENWNPNHKIEVSTSDNMTNALAEIAKRLPD